MIYLFAGEQSGDLHGAALAARLANHPLRGVAGPKMREAGVIGSLKMEQFSVMGITDVLRHLPSLLKLFHEVRDEILNLKPEAVVLIDYPAFNIRLAKALRKKGYTGKLIHYVCPSVWAHGKGRIQKMAKTLDLLMTIFPFEPDCFKGTGLETLYVGNPTVEAIRNYRYDNNWMDKVDIDPRGEITALFPGSRIGEVKRNLPLQLQAIELAGAAKPAISCAHPDLLPLISKIAPHIPVVPPQYHYELMRDSKRAIATSGTVTLELALHQRPTVVNYALTPLNRFIAKNILRLNLPYYCIVNILAGREVFPELIASGSDPKAIAKALQSIDEEETIRGCSEVAQMLGTKSASHTAAEKIESLLKC